MFRPARKLDGATVVIAGASSGIGRAAATAFAARGARVVVAARRADLLDEVAAECRRRGGDALAVPTDVTDPDAVRQLAEEALAEFGRVDVWINNAAAGVFGRFDEADLALHRQVIEVGLLGAMHGAYAILPIFRRQGTGVMINTCSLGSWAPVPFAAAYTATKFGLRGFTASLRQEIARGEDIHVCAVFPAMVDTPGFVHGANMSGRTLDPGPLLYTSEDVAETMVELARHPRGEVSVGWPARAGQIAYNLSPRVTEIAIGAVMRGLVRRAGPAPRQEGALLKTVPAGRGTSGGWLDRKGLPKAGTISGAAGLAVLGGIALLVGGRALSRLRSRSRRR